MSKGKIIPNGVSLEKHENDTVVFFTNLGKDVELIPPSNTPRVRRADFKMDGITWEAKSPLKATKLISERALHKALKQSPNVIIDLRRAKGDNHKIVIQHLYHCFSSSKKAKRLTIITKQNRTIDYKK